MWGYIKCSYYNRYTLFGYLLTVPGIIGMVALVFRTFLFVNKMNHHAVIIHLCVLGVLVILSLIGVILLGGSAFALETYRSYTRAKTSLESNNKLVFMIRPQHYCSRVGLELAIKEKQKN